jgi:hypothetical protein
VIASEVIAKLQALVEAHGDLELRVPIGGGCCGEGGSYTPDPPEYVPERRWLGTPDPEHFYLAP